MMILQSILSFLSFAEPSAVYNMDQLATVSLPKSFHRELPHAFIHESVEELKRPVEERVKRLPYRFNEPDGNGVTFYYLQHDEQKIGGRDLPVVMRITLYRKGKAQEDVQSYLKRLKRDVHYHEPKPLTDENFSSGRNDVLYSEKEVSRSGWFSVYKAKQMQFIVTDLVRNTRISLTVLDEFYSKEKALALIDQTMKSVTRNEEKLLKELDYIENIRTNASSIKQKNFEDNLRKINSELATKNLPPLEDKFELRDNGSYIYGLEGYEGFRKFIFVCRDDQKNHGTVTLSLERMIGYRPSAGYSYVATESLYQDDIAFSIPKTSPIKAQPMIIWTFEGIKLYEEGFNSQGEIRVNFVGQKEENGKKELVFHVQEKNKISYDGVDPEEGGEFVLGDYIVQISGLKAKKIEIKPR